MRTTSTALAVVAALLVLTGGCRSMTGRTAGELVDNKLVQAKVKTKLAAAQLRNLSWVNVDVNDRVVYLTGNARTAEDKARATEIAQRVRGVDRVVNDIHVNTATAGARSAAPAASPRTATASASALTGEVVKVDQGSGAVTVRMADGSDVELRLPSSSVRDVRPGDRLSVSINAGSR